MKYLVFLVFLIITSFCFSQSKPQVEYRGGTTALAKINFTTDREYDTEEYPDAKTNRFYIVKFTLDSIGKIKNKIMIISTSTIDIDTAIIGLMKITDGKWINHTGHDIDVVFPITFLFNDGSGSENRQRCDLITTSFFDWKKIETIILEPLVITTFPPMH